VAVQLLRTFFFLDLHKLLLLLMCARASMGDDGSTKTMELHDDSTTFAHGIILNIDPGHYGLVQGVQPSTHRPVQDRLGELTRVKKNAAEVLERAAVRRRRHHPHGSRSKPGHAPSTLDGLLTIHRYTLLCTDCDALVDMRSAKVQAKKEKRTILISGDGCASASCSSCFRRSDFIKQQKKMAEQLLTEERLLIAWPTDSKDVDFWQPIDLGLTNMMAHEILSKLNDRA
jgi:hypothetical protein